MFCNERGHNVFIFQELRGNIRVYCRVRPLLAMLDSNNNTELLGIPNTSSEQIVNAVDDESICFNQQSSAGTAPKVKQYEFERVYKQDESQEVLFFDVAPLLISLLDGYVLTMDCVKIYLFIYFTLFTLRSTHSHTLLVLIMIS